MPILATTFPSALLTASAVAVACATLSVFVVARRWAFIGEGIGHSGFGGAGTAWLLALVFPSLDGPEMTWLPYLGVIVFCILSAIGIGRVTRHERTHFDTAIGIFMVASLAWGFVAEAIYRARRGVSPRAWETFLFGNMPDTAALFTIASVLMALAVVATVTLLGKEILYYCYDSTMAEASGVRAGLIHYLLILLVTATIIIGSRVVGSVLVTALLVLPGATSLSFSRRLVSSVVAAVGIGLLGAIAGLSLNRVWPILPTGPAIVLVLFVLFAVAFAAGRARRA